MVSGGRSCGRCLVPKLTTDDKVSEVTADKVTSMDGGGEDSVAYILLYRYVVLEANTLETKDTTDAQLCRHLESLDAIRHSPASFRSVPPMHTLS